MASERVARSLACAAATRPEARRRRRTHARCRYLHPVERLLPRHRLDARGRKDGGPCDECSPVFTVELNLVGISAAVLVVYDRRSRIHTTCHV